jgi:hypothetical protein
MFSMLVVAGEAGLRLGRAGQASEVQVFTRERRAFLLAMVLMGLVRAVVVRVVLGPLLVLAAQAAMASW